MKKNEVSRGLIKNRAHYWRERYTSINTLVLNTKRLSRYLLRRFCCIA